MRHHSQLFRRRLFSDALSRSWLASALPWALSLCCVLPCWTVGCSPLEPSLNGFVGGVITHAGKPVSGGQIAFHGESGGDPIVATLRADGTYAVEGISSGRYRVSITGPDLPERYADPETSELTVDVVASDGPFTADFDLR